MEYMMQNEKRVSHRSQSPRRGPVWRSIRPSRRLRQPWPQCLKRWQRGRHWGLWIVETPPRLRLARPVATLPRTVRPKREPILIGSGNWRPTKTSCSPVRSTKNWVWTRTHRAARALCDSAKEIVANEPMARAGYRINTVKSWTVNEGSITVRVDLMANQMIL